MAEAEALRGAVLSHHGDDCTFETMVKRSRFEDPALRRLAEALHDADLGDGKFQAPEAVGLDRTFKGWARLGVADEEILERGLLCFDGLFAAFPSDTKPKRPR